MQATLENMGVSRLAEACPRVADLARPVRDTMNRVGRRKVRCKIGKVCLRRSYRQIIQIHHPDRPVRRDNELPYMQVPVQHRTTLRHWTSRDPAQGRFVREAKPRADAKQRIIGREVRHAGLMQGGDCLQQRA
ncbi:hypothetical protein ATO11_20300 [Pseudaestuariivita atlantica]|uniref:Uncharacterized protein n=1 Tax=Pseudaestuariivita atlantica TaxID=1317121 RepID=A0A0L1JJG7_9RHOB|nr:hypothetical protein ATO11_20300 [Pseudaestuariivita atlantica]